MEGGTAARMIERLAMRMIGRGKGSGDERNLPTGRTRVLSSSSGYHSSFEETLPLPTKFERDEGEGSEACTHTCLVQW
jgi:hypothetical protein